MAHGGDELDWSAIGGLAAKDAGEEGRRSQAEKSDNGAAIKKAIEGVISDMALELQSGNC
jgi:hypothetical protein